MSSYLFERESTSVRESDDYEIAEICYNSVNGTCKKGIDCQRLHAKRHFQWQVLGRGYQWHNLTEAQENCLEKAFCNPSLDGVALPSSDMASEAPHLFKIIGEGPWQVDFNYMELIDSKNQIPTNLRRLCSERLKGRPVMPSDFAWYFCDINNEWIEYGDHNYHLVSSLTSAEIEQCYNENQDQTIQLHNRKYSYILNFTTMMQTNLLTEVNRAVRRRPEHHLTSQSKCKFTMKSELPHHWDPMGNDILKRVKLSEASKEFKKILDSLRTAVYPGSIEQIERIQNPFLWIAYQNKVQEMFSVCGDMAEVNVRQLFHGTRASVVDKICKENFDWRLHGTRAGQKYGRGTYFSPNTNTAYRYCNLDKTSRCHLFVARVAVGTYTVGHGKMVRPPNNPTTGRLYDSTVDNDSNPNIIVKYDKQEYYPEYLVTIDTNKD